MYTNTFIITYEYRFDSIFNENRLISTIKSFGNWSHPMKSVWLIKTNLPRDVVMNYFTQYLNSLDKLLIMKVNDEWISIHLDSEVVNWMKSGL